MFTTPYRVLWLALLVVLPLLQPLAGAYRGLVMGYGFVNFFSLSLASDFVSLASPGMVSVSVSSSYFIRYPVGGSSIILAQS